MDGNKLKEGVSVREIEDFTKKHRFEVFFCLAFVFACIFSTTFWSQWWSILAVSVGGVAGVLTPGKVEHFAKKVFHFIFKQEQVTQLILGIVGLVISILLSPLIFLLMGLHAGKSMYHMAMELFSQHNPPKD